MDLKELGNVNPETHWYYNFKAETLIGKNKGKLGNPKVIVEIGAGSAFFLNKASVLFPQAECIAVDPYYDIDNFPEYKNLKYSLCIPKKKADLVMLIDVLEHVEDDLQLLSDAARSASQGSKYIISVPAFEFLWSGHDDFLGHKRRYKAKELAKLAESAGLKVEDGGYLFGGIFPAVVLFRFTKKILGKSKGESSDMRPIRKVINNFMKVFLKLTGPINKNRYFGLSAFVIASKI